MHLGALVAKDGVLEAVKSCEDESRRVSGLVNFSILHVVLEDLDTALASEYLLVVATVLGDIRQDVEGELSDVQSAGLGLVLNQVEEGLDEVTLHKVDLEELKEGGG